MYNLYDKISHPSHGLCEVAEICDRLNANNDEKTTYYKLIPQCGAETLIYVPADRAEMIGLRSLITKEEAHSLINSLSDSKEDWISNVSAKQKKYKSLFLTNTLENLLESLSFIGAIIRHNETKTLGLNDKNMLANLENKVMSELAFVLEITVAEAIQQAEDLILS